MCILLYYKWIPDNSVYVYIYICMYIYILTLLSCHNSHNISIHVDHNKKLLACG